MNTNDPSAEIERRLRSEAERLGRLDSVPVPAARLYAEHTRGRRRRAARAAAAVLVPALLLLAGWLALSGSPGPTASDRSVAQRAAPLAPDDHRRSPGSFTRGDAAGDTAAERSAAGEAGVFAVPIVIIRLEDGQEVVSPGFLVPAHEAPLDFRDLSPAEQRAVRQVLDLGGEPHHAI